MDNHLKNFGVPLPNGNKGGIMQPMYQYRFRIIFECDLGVVMDENSKTLEDTTLTQNITYANVDFVKRQFSLGIRQPLVGSDVFNKIWEISKIHSQKIYLDALDGGVNTTMTGVFSGSILKDHNVMLTYSESGYVEHKLIFEFSQFSAYNECVWKKTLERWFAEEEIKNHTDSGIMTPAEALKKIEESTEKTNNSK